MEGEYTDQCDWVQGVYRSLSDAMEAAAETLKEYGYWEGEEEDGPLIDREEQRKDCIELYHENDEPGWMITRIEKMRVKGGTR